MSVTRLMTGEVLERLTEDDFRYELVRGELVRMCPVNYKHLRVTYLVACYRLSRSIEGGSRTTTG